MIEVSFLPGVTDPVAEQIIRAAHELGLEEIHRATTGTRYMVNGLDQTTAKKLAARLLANTVIQQWTIGEITPSFPEETELSGVVEIIPVRNLNEDELLAVSKNRRAALDLAEMCAIQNYFIKEQRDPSDVEFETIAQTWSEHCGHKTFKAKIDIRYSNPDLEYRISKLWIVSFAHI